MRVDELTKRDVELLGPALYHPDVVRYLKTLRGRFFLWRTVKDARYIDRVVNGK